VPALIKRSTQVQQWRATLFVPFFWILFSIKKRDTKEMSEGKKRLRCVEAKVNCRKRHKKDSKSTKPLDPVNEKFFKTTL